MDNNNFVLILNNINMFDTIQHMLSNMLSENYNINNDEIQISIELYESTELPEPYNTHNTNNTNYTHNINCYKTCAEINNTLCKPIKIKINDTVLNDNCMICMDEYKINQFKRILPTCNHFFHKKCIDKWFKKNITCPVCRVEAKI